jgi:hypothetical protein
MHTGPIQSDVNEQETQNNHQNCYQFSHHLHRKDINDEEKNCKNFHSIASQWKHDILYLRFIMLCHFLG